MVLPWLLGWLHFIICRVSMTAMWYGQKNTFGLRINVMACVMWALFHTLNQSNNGSNKSKFNHADLFWIDPASTMPPKLGNPPFMLAETRWSNCSTLLCPLSTLEQLNNIGHSIFCQTLPELLLLTSDYHLFNLLLKFMYSSNLFMYLVKAKFLSSFR